MAPTVEREALIEQHNKLKMDIEAINAETRKLERANDYLRRQNANLRRVVEGRQASDAFSGDNGNTASGVPEASSGVYGAQDSGSTHVSRLVDVLSQAAAAGQVATDEILRRARSIADDFTNMLEPPDEAYHPDVGGSVLQSIIKQRNLQAGGSPSLSSNESMLDSASEPDNTAPDTFKIVHTGYPQEAPGKENGELRIDGFSPAAPSGGAGAATPT
ncbi:deoxyribonuclease IV [Babesia caballi]|uniref:Deoxyribonuclease IV n=1 Tax=Babesia caballi TaxID=5871 RepID=A0AAV4LRM2_BABCB|nr:deoxyribonuclease IV [Babesia caballi]